MIKILFVCHGNICRSPMAEYVFKKLIKEAHLKENFFIDSAATSTEEIGNPVYPPARRILSQHGISDITHTARQFTSSDYAEFDHIFVMDKNNLRNILRMNGGDPNEKISLLLGTEEIEDPWYTGNFQKVYEQIEKGCKNVLDELQR